MKISVNAGHTKSGAGSGANYKGFNEGEIARAVANALIKKLKKENTRRHITTEQQIERGTAALAAEHYYNIKYGSTVATELIFA